jgi:hypothetical protein
VRWAADYYRHPLGGRFEYFAKRLIEDVAGREIGVRGEELLEGFIFRRPSCSH